MQRKENLDIEAQMHLLLPIQLLVVDVRVIVKDDVNGVRIERYLQKATNA
jgi:hypothetical protein